VGAHKAGNALGRFQAFGGFSDECHADAATTGLLPITDCP